MSALDCLAWQCLFCTTDPAQAGPKPIVSQGAPPGTESFLPTKYSIKVLLHIWQTLPATQSERADFCHPHPWNHNVITKNDPGIMKIRAQSTAGTGV